MIPKICIKSTESALRKTRSSPDPRTCPPQGEVCDNHYNVPPDVHTMEEQRNSLKDLLVGIVVGIASMLPGISGATMMVVFGLYERLIRDLAKLRVYLVRDFRFIAIIVVGFAIGTVVCAKILNQALEDYPVEAMMLFLGLIGGQLPVLWRTVRSDAIKEDRPLFDAKSNIAFGAGLAVMIAMVLFDIFCRHEDAVINHDAYGFIIMILIGAVVAVSAILPGLSHSTLLLVLGLMTAFTKAISDFDFVFIAALAIGVFAGVFGFARVIEKALERHHLHTMLLIVGLTVGSLLVIGWNVVDSYDGIVDAVAGIVCLFIGLELSILSTKFENSTMAETLNE